MPPQAQAVEERSSSAPSLPPDAGRGLSRPRRPRGWLSLLLLGAAIALLLGMYTGLARAGTNHRFVAADLHGVLMVLGFLGTLVALERAVVSARRWGYLAPGASAAAVVALPFSATFGVSLLLAAGLGLTAIHAAAFRDGQRGLAGAVTGAGALAWAAAAGWWLAGAGPIRITPLLAAFLVLTAVGGRVGAGHLGRLTDAAKGWLAASVGAFAVGAALTPVWRPSGLVLAGLGLLGQAAWLVRHDPARRTVGLPGLPRFVALAVLGSTPWLAVSGLLWVAMGTGATGPLLHDALVHSLFLGFVLPMVVGHGLVALPALQRGARRLVRLAYVPLVVLHLSVALRVGADLAGSTWWRELALHGNVGALSLLVLVTVLAVRQGTGAAAAPPSVTPPTPPSGTSPQERAEMSRVPIAVPGSATGRGAR